MKDLDLLCAASGEVDGDVVRGVVVQASAETLELCGQTNDTFQTVEGCAALDAPAVVSGRVGNHAATIATATDNIAAPTGSSRSRRHR